MNIPGYVVILMPWFTGALAAFLIQADEIKRDDEAMPGGGWPVVVIRSMAWPIIVVVALVGLIAMLSC